MNTGELAELLGGRVENDRSGLVITGVNTLQDASASEASFLANMRYKQALHDSQAGVVIVAETLPASVVEGRTVIRVADPYLAFARLQRHFHPAPVSNGEHHPSAVIDPSASIGEQVQIGAQAVVEKNAVIGSNTIVGAGCIIGEGSTVGEGCLLHPRSVVCHGSILGNRVILQSGAVIGSDGFGFAWSGSEHMKIPQTGRAILEDDVEIGSHTCIDRGALGDTIIRRGAKLDNLIQIAHNVEIGPYCVIAGQSGFAGSTTLGAGCQVGAQAGVAGHLHIGDRAQIGAKSGVIGNLDGGQAYAGFPAVPHRMWLKANAILRKLPEFWEGMKK